MSGAGNMNHTHSQGARAFGQANSFVHQEPRKVEKHLYTAMLEVLPVSSTFTKVTDESGPVAEAAGDFNALEHLRRLAYSERVREPEQLKLWTEGQT